jgi:hypothetical protein
MTNYRVSRSYNQMGDSPFAAFAGSVGTKLTANPSFPTPPVDPDDLKDEVAVLQTRIQAARQGGPVDVSLKDQQRALVAGMMRKMATYVEMMAGTELAKLQSSGFDAVSTNRAPYQLAKPVITRIYNPVSTVLGVKVPPVASSRAFEARVHNGTEEWFQFGGFKSTRDILVPNRVPGQTYTVQVRAIGGLTGYSDWSDPVSHMAT